MFGFIYMVYFIIAIKDWDSVFLKAYYFFNCLFQELVVTWPSALCLITPPKAFSNCHNTMLCGSTKWYVREWLNHSDKYCSQQHYCLELKWSGSFEEDVCMYMLMQWVLRLTAAYCTARLHGLNLKPAYCWIVSKEFEISGKLLLKMFILFCPL